MNDPFEDRFTEEHPIIQNMVKNSGVLCLSRHEAGVREVLNEPLMWAHYAANHSGIAIGLEHDEENVGKYNKVDYFNEAERAQRVDVLLRNYAENRDQSISPWAEITFKHKLKFCEYENEYRRVYVGNGYVDPCAVVCEVIFGFRTHLSDELAVWSALRDKIKYRKVSNQGGKLQLEDYQPPTSIETIGGDAIVLDQSGEDCDAIPEQPIVIAASHNFVNPNKT